MGVDYKTTPPPEIRMVSKEDMAKVTCGQVYSSCTIYPAVFDGQALYILEDLDYIKDKAAASFIVHHMVHAVQFRSVGGDLKKMEENQQKFEQQAMELQIRWFQQIEAGI